MISGLIDWHEARADADEDAVEELPGEALLLRCLQLMCEGHFRPNQDLLRTRSGASAVAPDAPSAKGFGGAGAGGAGGGGGGGGAGGAGGSSGGGGGVGSGGVGGAEVRGDGQGKGNLLDATVEYLTYLSLSPRASAADAAGRLSDLILELLQGKGVRV